VITPGEHCEGNATVHARKLIAALWTLIAFAAAPPALADSSAMPWMNANQSPTSELARWKRR
jgi:hypothetical protein